MSFRFLRDPSLWRGRAEQMRLMMWECTDTRAKAVMERIAMDYELLAQISDTYVAPDRRGAKILEVDPHKSNGNKRHSMK